MEKKRLDIEKARLESDERMKREERQHQFQMMKMIMGVVGQAGSRFGPPPFFNQQSTVPPNVVNHGPGPSCFPTVASYTSPGPSNDNADGDSSFNSSGDLTYFNS